jgi:peptide/nickel transport system ATP-binding protein
VSKRFTRSRVWSAGKVEVLALSRLSLDVYRGEVLGIVGESGSGKTTLGRIAVGLIPSSSGRVIFDGRDLSSISKREKRGLRRRMGMVFQNPLTALNPRMRVGEAVAEPLRVQLKLSPDNLRLRLKELFKEVGLPFSFIRAYPFALSTGQRQRLGIARAIATTPELVVLDEPVSALDLTVQAQILTLLSRLSKKLGLTYLFISHDLRVVAGMSDRVAVIYQGKLVELGGAKEVMMEAKHPYTRLLLASIPGSKNREEEGIGFPANEGIVIASGCPFSPRCPRADDICIREEPLLRTVSSSHAVSCHLIE